jgi:uncharacterized transporter YbjL
MKKSTKRAVSYTGIGVAIGAGFGVILFAFTREAWTIGIGVAVGLMIGAIIDGVKNSQKPRT